MKPLKALHGNGQSVWLDYARRDLLNNGGLKQLIEDDGALGVPSHPAIFPDIQLVERSERFET